MHFSLLVVTEDDGMDVEEVMEPYEVGYKVEPHICAGRDELLKWGKEYLHKIIEADFDSPFDTEIKKVLDGFTKEQWIEYAYTYILEEEWGAEMVERNWSHITRILDLYKSGKLDELTDDDYIWYATRGENPRDIDEDGNLWTTDSGQERWDWYSIGGRYEKVLFLLPEAKKKYEGEYDKDGAVDSAYVKDIDWERVFSITSEQANYIWRKWKYWIMKEEYPGTKEEFEEEFRNCYANPDYYREKCKDFSDYILLHHFCTSAVLDENGWHEPDAPAYDEDPDWIKNYYKQFIKPLKPNQRVTMVDYHI